MMAVMCESIKACSKCLQNQCKFLVFKNTQVCVESGRAVAGAVSIIPKGNGFIDKYFYNNYILLISGAGTHCPKDTLQLPFSTWELGKLL
jgi:hypothetical protein